MTPTIEEWLRMSDADRRREAGRWNAYHGEGSEIAKFAAEGLKQHLANVQGISISGPGIYHGGGWVIVVATPFVFDKRRIPEAMLGIRVHRMSPDLPPEFVVGNSRKEYVWAPQRYEAFVDRAADEIRATLGDPGMSRMAMLDALFGGDFERFKTQCRVWEDDGTIPRYRKR